MLAPDAFETLRRCYRVISTEVRGPHPSTWHVEVPNWENYLMSPLLLQRPLRRAELQATLQRWNSHCQKKQVLPYWTFFGRLSPAESEIRTELKAAKWKELRPGRQGNLLTRRVPLELPRGYRLETGLPTERALFKIFSDSGHQNFKSTDAYHRLFIPLFKAYENRFRLIVIRTRQGKPATTGVIANHQGYGFFLSGAVFPRYRGLGLWRQLVAARQSTDFDTHTWYYFTTNPLLKNRGSARFAISHLAKTAQT